MSPEQTKAAGHQQAAAESRYIEALRSIEALGQDAASVEARCRGRAELNGAERALLDVLWNSGELSNAADLGRHIESYRLALMAQAVA